MTDTPESIGLTYSDSAALSVTAEPVAATPARLEAGRSRTQPTRTISHRDGTERVAWDDPSAERVPVFTVERDGEQVVYSMPAKPNPGLMLRFLRDARNGSPTVALDLIASACGEEALDAFVDELQDREPEEATDLMAAISRRIQENIGGGL